MKTMNKAIIVDIDGTLADCSHRLHHIKKTPKDWKSFHAGVLDDTLNVWCKEIIRGINGCEVLLVSGRVHESLLATKMWLSWHGIPYSKLFMRKPDDYRDDHILKQEVYEKYIKGEYEILFVIEDRKRTVDMWRSLGLTVLQCAGGEF